MSAGSNSPWFNVAPAVALGGGVIVGSVPNPITPTPVYDRVSLRNRIKTESGVLFEQAMAQTRMAICLADPNQEDQPIVFVNRAFRELTGYEEDEIVGRNCRFLQGPGTDPAQVRLHVFPTPGDAGSGSEA